MLTVSLSANLNRVDRSNPFAPLQTRNCSTPIQIQAVKKEDSPPGFELRVTPPRDEEPFERSGSLFRELETRKSEERGQKQKLKRAKMERTRKRARKIQSFNTSIGSFAAMLEDHIASSQRFKDRIIKKRDECKGGAAKDDEYNKNRLKNGGLPGGEVRRSSAPVGGLPLVLVERESEMGWDDMVNRMGRLRERDWKMPEFDAERTKALCERALGDLERGGPSRRV